MKNVVDSSGWLEFFADGENAEAFAEPIQNVEHLVVPTISILDVFKRVLQQRDETSALQAAAIMRQGSVVGLSADLAIGAAALGHRERLPLADSVILATARQHGAILWTQDADFEGLAGVRYFSKEK